MMSDTSHDPQELPWDIRKPRNYPSEMRCVELLEEVKEMFNSIQYYEALDLLEQIKSELSSSNNNKNMLKT